MLSYIHTILYIYKCNILVNSNLTNTNKDCRNAALKFRMGIRMGLMTEHKKKEKKIIYLL